MTDKRTWADVELAARRCHVLNHVELIAEFATAEAALAVEECDEKWREALGIATNPLTNDAQPSFILGVLEEREKCVAAAAVEAEREECIKVAACIYGGPPHTMASENADRYAIQDDTIRAIIAGIRSRGAEAGK